MRWFALIIIAALACDPAEDAAQDAQQAVACEDAPREEVDREAEPACQPRTPRREPDGRRCRRDLFVVDVPIEVQLDPAHEAMSADVQARLDAHLGSLFGPAPVHEAWFGPGACNGAIRTLREDVFAGSGLADGRHQRFSFCCEADCDAEVPRRLAVRPEAACDVVATLRRLYGQPGAGDDYYVGRDCDARAQGADDWHLEALDYAPPPPDGGQEVTVAVVDTAGGHGDSAAALISQVAPAAQIEHFEGLSHPEGGPTTEVAAVLGLVVDLFAGRPDALVVNLSFGWPPEMGQRFGLGGAVSTVEEGAACATEEGPAGEAVRSALAALRLRGDTVVIAAAGNRVAPMNPDVYGNNARGAPACPAATAGDGGALFYPAAWSKVHTCTADQRLQGEPLVVSVGATAPAGVPPASLRLPADLLAPGRMVRLPDTGALSSGTSWATAIVSGLAAATRSLSNADVIARSCVDPDGVRHAHPQPQSAPCPTPNSFALPPAPPPCGARCEQGTAMSRWQASNADWTYGADAHAQGLAAPQPTVDGCPEDDCKVAIHAGYDRMDFYARLHPDIDNLRYGADPRFARIEDVELVVEADGVRYGLPLSPAGGSKDWVGDVSYSFGSYDLPSTLFKDPARVKKAGFRLEFRLIDGKGGVSERSEPLSVSLP